MCLSNAPYYPNVTRFSRRFVFRNDFAIFAPDNNGPNTVFDFHLNVKIFNFLSYARQYSGEVVFALGAGSHEFCILKSIKNK